MGQKVNPVIFRLGTRHTWQSRWYANKKTYQQFALKDVLLRRELMKKLKPAGVTNIEIERLINKMTVIMHVARPGVVIGRGGSGLEQLKKYITDAVKSDDLPKDFRVDVQVKEVKHPDLNAYLVAMNISDQIARRMPPKRVAKQAIERVMNAGAKGVKIALTGRISGAEIARREKYLQGSVPLQTIRKNIDYATAPSLTRSGYVGVKVWIYKEDKED